jgi:hypothetical protein
MSALPNFKMEPAFLLLMIVRGYLPHEESVATGDPGS